MMRLLLLSFLAAAMPLAAFQKEQDAARAPAPDQVLAVRIHQVLTGYTRARAEMELTTEVAGSCLEVHADIGLPIGSEGVFARLDPLFLELDLHRVRKEKERLTLDGTLLARDAVRYKNLLEQKLVSPSDYEDYQNRHAQNLVALDAVAIEEEILLERLKRFSIKAPPGWLVIERYLEPGEWVQQGALVARLGDYSRLYVALALDEAALNFVRSQTTLELRLTETGRRVTARLARVSPAYDPQTRKIAVDLELDGEAAGNRGGIRAELVIRSQPVSGEVLVPEAALTRRYDEYAVVTGDGQRVPVRLLGADSDGYVRVAGDLQPGQRLQLEAR